MRRPSSRIFWISVLVLLALSPARAASAQAARLAPRAHPRLLTALENGSDDLSVIVALKEVTKYAPATESASPGDADREARTRRLAAQWRLAAQMSGSDFQATRFYASFPLMAARTTREGAIALFNRSDVAWVTLDGIKRLTKTSPPLQDMQRLIRSPRANALGFTGKGQAVAVL